jgi:hypothetical protein
VNDAFYGVKVVFYFSNIYQTKNTMTHLIENLIQSLKPKWLVMPESTELSVELILGNPQAECCRFGICKMERWAGRDKDFYPESSNHTLALMSIEEDLENVLLNFLTTKLSVITSQVFFGNGVFVVESDFHFSSAVGLPKQYHSLQIPKGRFEVEYSPQYLKVRLPYTSKTDTS